MASILRRGDSYSVRFKYKDHAGRICEGWESFKTKKEAQDRKISVEKELLDGTFLIPDAMTVAEMLYKWLPIQSSKHKWAPKTYTHTVAMIQNLVVPYLGKKQIQKVQTYDLEQFYATLSRTPRGLYKQGGQANAHRQAEAAVSDGCFHPGSPRHAQDCFFLCR